MFAASFSRPKDAPLKARSEEISPLAFSFPRKLEARMSPPKLGAGGRDQASISARLRRRKALS